MKTYLSSFLPDLARQLCFFAKVVRIQVHVFSSSLLVVFSKNIKQTSSLKIDPYYSCFVGMGAAGLEPAETEVGGFTVPCNCRYATPPLGVSGYGSLSKSSP